MMVLFARETQFLRKYRMAYRDISTSGHVGVHRAKRSAQPIKFDERKSSSRTANATSLLQLSLQCFSRYSLPRDPSAAYATD